MIKKIKYIIHSRVARNAGWLIGGRIIQIIISFAVGLLTARYLGPSNYGLINYAGAYTVFFSAICTLGINSVLVKEFVDNPGEESTVIGTSLGLRAISSLLSAFMICGISFFADAGEPTTQIVVMLCSLGVVFQIFETFNYWFQARLQSKTTAIVTLIAYMVTSAYKVFLLATQKPVTYFAFATSVDYICVAILLFVCYKKQGGGKLRFSKKYGWSLLKKSYHFILPGLMVAIYGQTDKIMLKHIVNDAETGYYSTAITLCTIWCFVLNAIIDSLFPPIMEAFRNDKQDFDKKNKLLYSIVFYVSVAVSVLFTLFGGFFIRFLYGEAYLPSVAPLRVITWSTAFSYLGVARNAWIVCMNRQRCLKYIYLSAAVFNVILNFLFIPLWGATGAAVASLAAQIITTFIAPFFIKDMRENSIMMVKAILFK